MVVHRCQVTVYQDYCEKWLSFTFYLPTFCILVSSCSPLGWKREIHRKIVQKSPRGCALIRVRVWGYLWSRGAILQFWVYRAYNIWKCVNYGTWLWRCFVPNFPAGTGPFKITFSQSVLIFKNLAFILRWQAKVFPQWKLW